MTTDDNASKTPPTPELDRRSEILATGAPQALTDFVDWLHANGYTIARLCTHPDQKPGRRCWDCGDSGFVGGVTEDELERLFARSFGLNPEKIEAERRALLESLR